MTPPEPQDAAILAPGGKIQILTQVTEMKNNFTQVTKKQNTNSCTGHRNTKNLTQVTEIQIQLFTEVTEIQKKHTGHKKNSYTSG